MCSLRSAAKAFLSSSLWAFSCACLVMADEVDFAKQIRPLLSDRCFACHGPDATHREADLRLDQVANLMEDRGDYRVVVPGNKSASELYRRVTSVDEGEVMPPPETGKTLTPVEQELIGEWIAAGAQWKQHWAYERPVENSIPAVAGNFAGNNFIDAFLAERIQPAGGTFSEPADSITLLRRLAFDLTGLPPGLQDVEEFARDSSETAVANYAEKLLSSPGFGERMAMYWLDLVRFADTVGYHGDQDHNISPYRDYVVNAFNDNLPFDKFTTEQLAGDLLPAPSEEQLVATGYNRLLQTSHEGGVQPKEYLAIYQADRVRNFSAVWLGGTVGCAQCHDHKFDPYTAHDFYSLAAFFADIDEAQHFKLGSNSLPTERPPEMKVLGRSEKLLLARYEQTQGEPTLGKDATKDKSDAEAAIQQLKAAARATMITVAIQPREIRYLPRGNWLDDTGALMQPHVPAFLSTIDTAGRRPNRLDLANWLTDAEQGVGLLTARVFVNRLWMLLFGQGLSRSVEDFGGQGEPPSHPELLDNLAHEFVRSGWDIKHMLRLITHSRAYRQSSAVDTWHTTHDPLNFLLARQNRFRVSAEVVRDTSLACSGLLVQQVGGASVRPYQPEDYYRHLNFPTREYQASQDGGQWRRGVYVHWQRQFLHPMLRSFDAPTREECTAQRTQSNTPLAALVWLNDPSFVEAARGLAHRVLTTAPPGARERASLIFRTATSRVPDEIELQTLLELFQASLTQFAADPAAAQQLLSVGMLEIPAKDPAELAAWTMVARAVLNLNETYTRN